MELSQAMTMTDRLFQNRNDAVAKSFYRHLRSEGFTNQQIIELSASLLDLVTEGLRKEQPRID